MTHITWKYGGNSVNLAGTFNNWNPGHMRKKNNVWYAILNLSPGYHQFKFIVDGVWMYDIDRNFIDDGSGNINNWIWVDEDGGVGGSVSQIITQHPPLIRNIDSEISGIPHDHSLKKEKSIFGEEEEVDPEHPPKLRSIRRRKFSSTSTLFLRSVISAPDVKEIVVCLSRTLYRKIKNHEKITPKNIIEIFSEENYPLGDGKTELHRIPTQPQIQEFLVLLFSSQDLDAQCGVMTAIYVDRLLSVTEITLHPSNWRRIVLGALLIASKIWEDTGVWNVDYLYSLPNLSLHDLLRLEHEFLICLQFSVNLTPSVYAKYYFGLRSLSDLTEDNFPLRPLDHMGAEELEARSRGVEEEVRRKSRIGFRSSSLDPYRRDSPVTFEQFRRKFKRK